MSGVHLFAGDALAEGHRYPSGYVAVCGAVVQPCGASDRDDDPAYCPACVEAAVRWNAEADDRSDREVSREAAREVGRTPCRSPAAASLP
ncbi:MAG: hypothetical protein ACRDRG_01585 [Pseudonocardiaceae bacterium]